jgi:hypothetical protein
MVLVAELISKYGFPIVCASGIGYMIYYVWRWVTMEIKPVLAETNNTLIELIDKIRMLDQDLIRLDQKITTVIELRGKALDHERQVAAEEINRL